MKITKDKKTWHKNKINRKNFLSKIGIIPSSLASAEITHENLVKIVDKRNAGKTIRGADGLITQEKNIYLSITSADCLPIFLFDPKYEIIGIIHAGWRSLAKNILINAIEKIQKLGGRSKNILVGIGPAICQKHYEVGPEVAQKFEKYLEAIKREDKKIFLDLKKIAELQLSDLGIKKENIETNPECTFELPKKYFSARRDKEKEIKAMIAMIGIKK